MNGPFRPTDPTLDVDALAAQLLAPLTREQQLVVNTAAEAFFKSGDTWPTYQHVEAILDREGQDARWVISTFPVVGTSMQYAALRCATWAGSLNDDSRVELTVLGLHHYSGVFKAKAEALVRDGLRVLQMFIDARRGFIPPATEVKHLELSSDDLLARLRPGSPDLPAPAVLAGIIQTEPPLSSSLGGSGSSDGKWTWTIRRGSLVEFDGVGLDVEDYVRQIVGKYHVVRLLEQPVLTSPLTLAAALGYLDTAWRVMEGRDTRLIVLPSPERAASLAFEAGTRAEYLERVGALGDVLKCLRVPAGGNQDGGHPLKRLRAYLSWKLPDESHERVNAALDQLGYVTDIRNGGLHADAEPKALRAYRALGIEFPVTDPGLAWGSVRTATVQALDAIREEVQGYVDSRASETVG